VAAARILGANNVALIGALGNDDIAERQIAILEAEGVITEAIARIPGEESGQAYIFIDRAGQNIIFSHLGANARLSTGPLDNVEAKGHLEKCRGIVLTDPPLEVACKLIEVAKERGIPLLWDPGILINQYAAALKRLISQVEVVFLNETEASALLGSEDQVTSLRHLKSLEVRNCVVLKLGSRGAMVVDFARSKMIRIPALPVRQLGLEVVNTVGCGDAFAGVFAAYYIMSSDVGRAVTMASVAAGLNATREETRGSPDRATLEEMLNRSLALGFAIHCCELI
jgi:sugar/nucleoside kinase (ribokinase family)